MAVLLPTQHTQGHGVVVDLSLVVILKHLDIQVHMILLLLGDGLDGLLQTQHILGSVTIHERIEGGGLLGLPLFVHPRKLSRQDIIGPQTHMTGLQDLRQAGVALSDSLGQTSFPGSVHDIVQQQDQGDSP